MKKYFKILILTLVLSTCYVLCATSSVSAQTPVSQSTTVSATVINYTLQLSGIASPYASIVLSTNSAFLQSTVANQSGSFSMQNISIGSGVSTVCFTVVDVRRVGESVTCIPIPPVQSNTAINNIFLPPTLGLYRSQIVAGATAILFGYSMPNARISVSLNNTSTHSVLGDSTGYYKIEVPSVKAGVYQLVSTAVSDGRPSLVPTKKVTLTAIQQVQKAAQNIGSTLLAIGERLLAFLLRWWWIFLLFLFIISFSLFLLWKGRKKKKEETRSKDSLSIINPPIKDTKITEQKFVREDQFPH